MKIIRMILLKDLRRFYPLLLVWIALLVSSDLLPIFGATALGDGWSLILGAGRWLFFGLIPIVFIQADALAGDRAFWMSRPFPPLTLVGAKLLGLGLTLVLPSVAVLVLAGRMLHTDGQILAAAWLEYGIALAAFVAVIAAFAAVTRSIVECLLAMVAVLLAFGIAQSALDHLGYRFLAAGRRLYWHLTGAPRPHNALTTWVATLLAAGLFALVVICYQAGTRRRGRAIALLVAGVILLGRGSSLWLGGDLKEGPRGGLVSGERFDLQTGPPSIEEDLQNGTAIYAAIYSNDAETANPPIKVTQVESILSAPALPPDRFVVASLSGSSFVAASDGHSWNSWSHWGRALAPTVISQEYDRMLRRVLGWEGPAVTTELPDTLLFDLPSSGYPALGGQRGRLEAKFSLAEFRLRLSEVPLLAGSEISADQVHLRLVRIRRETRPDGSIGVLVMVTYGGLLAWTEKANADLGLTNACAYLVNRSRREAIAAGDVIGNDSSSLFPYSLQGRSQALPFNLTGLEHVPPGHDRRQPYLDEAWLKDATLVVLAPQWLGTIPKTLTIDRFVMPAPKSP